MRWFFLVLGVVIVTLVVALGPRDRKFAKPPFELFPDMDRQAKLRFQKPSHFFDDDQGPRLPVEGTVPIGYAMPVPGDTEVTRTALDFGRGDEYLGTGRFGDYFGDGMPEELEVDDALLARGKQRYEINCVVCHGESGNGGGVVANYWTMPPTVNLIDGRVAALPDGQLFWTITHGKGLMGPYGGNITVEDRWAIVAYVRALQEAAGN